MTEEPQVITEESPEEETPTILRTARNGTFEVYKGAWGNYLRPCPDPDANVEITKEHLKHFEMREDVHRIPADLWARWIKLCFYYVDKVPLTVEVSIRFLRNATNPSEYRAVVPKQQVSAASVRADNFDDCCDLVTGEEFTSYPPEGWIPVGSSHSHNTMNAFFSGIDDKYELDDPGIHLTVGKIDTKNMRYEIAASVVGSKRRFIVPFDKIIDATPTPGINFHENVLKYVTHSAPTYRPSPVTRQATSNILRKLPPAKETKTYNSINEYFLDRYGNPYGEDIDSWDGGDYGWGAKDWERINDPFFYSDGHVDVTEQPKDVPLVSQDIYPIIDLLEDYLKDNRNDPDALEEMKQSLAAFLISVELELSQ